MVRKFAENESGAVTVDWVVLTAAIVGIAIAVLTVVSGGINSASTSISSGLWNASNNSIAGLITGGGTGTTTAGGTIYTYSNNGALGPAETAALIAADAPAGYNFNTPTATQADYIPVYTSNDGATYSIGGVVSPVAGNTTAFWYF